MKDIETRPDIELLVDSFYKKVIQDAVIGYIFNEVAHLSWEKHIPIMYQFWESVLLGTGGYKGNPILAHIGLDKKEPLLPKHFAHWQQLFDATVDELFAGERADLAKQRAYTMGQLMLFKIEASHQQGFIQ